LLIYLNGKTMQNTSDLSKKGTQDKPVELPVPGVQPEIKPLVDPEDPILPHEDPDIIPWENPFESPPSEIPPPGEGP
jgi:hypothetical protein